MPDDGVTSKKPAFFLMSFENLKFCFRIFADQIWHSVLTIYISAMWCLDTGVIRVLFDNQSLFLFHRWPLNARVVPAVAVGLAVSRVKQVMRNKRRKKKRTERDVYIVHCVNV